MRVRAWVRALACVLVGRGPRALEHGGRDGGAARARAQARARARARGQRELLRPKLSGWLVAWGRCSTTQLAQPTAAASCWPQRRRAAVGRVRPDEREGQAGDQRAWAGRETRKPGTGAGAVRRAAGAGARREPGAELEPGGVAEEGAGQAQMGGRGERKGAWAEVVQERGWRMRQQQQQREQLMQRRRMRGARGQGQKALVHEQGAGGAGARGGSGGRPRTRQRQARGRRRRGRGQRR